MPGWGTWALWGVAAYQQGYDPQAKPSTRLLARGANAVGCNTDLCQYLTNLSTNVTYCFEASTTRFNYSHPRTIGIRCNMTNAHTGTLFRHGSGANTEALQFSSGNNIRVIVANTILFTQALTVLTGSADEIVIAWRSEANPDTTGAANAVRSFLDIWNVTAGTHQRIEFAHVTKPLQAGATAVWGANTHPAGTAFGGTITAWWYENRLQSATEIAVDWVETRSEPSTDVDTESEDQGLPVTTAARFEGRDYFQGPSALIAVEKTRRLIRRTLSPLYNKSFRGRTTWDDADLDATDNPKIRAAPGDPGYRLFLGWLQVAAVPDTCTHLWVRVHVQSSSSSTAVPVGVRFYSFNRPPGGLGIAAEGLPPEPLRYEQVTEVINRDDTGVGEWCVEQRVPIARGTQGIRKNKTYLAIALQVDPEAAVANDADATVIVKACHAVPCFVREQGGVQFAESG